MAQTTAPQPTPQPASSAAPRSSAADATATPGPSPTGTREPMSRRQVLEALSGLLLGMFVAILSSTVVSTSLPVIIADLGGNQAAFTWVVTATLLATTVSTPIWGKLADLFDRKRLIQLALLVFVAGSALAALAPDAGTLIAFRVIQGLGAGGLLALSQIIMADIISPRERGRYAGWFSAVMGLGTIGGPLLGGLLTDALGWRWNFLVAIPFAIGALFLLQRTLKLPALPARKVSIDYLGIVLLAGGVSLLLIWVTLAGHQFEWLSTTTIAMVGGAVLMLVALIIVETRVAEPILPMRLFRGRTFTLAVIASLGAGVAMFGTSVFLAQYMQLARGATPTQSGLLTLPMIAGMLAASTIAGNLISRYGIWKPYLVAGAASLTTGMVLMGTIHYNTNYALLSVFMFLIGAGIGMVMQNLVMIVQTAADPKDLGVASSGVTFFRSLGGSVGVSVMGALLATQVAANLRESADAMGRAIAGLGDAGAAVAAQLQSDTLPHVASLPGSVRVLVEAAYGNATASIFLWVAPVALISLIAILFLPRQELATSTTSERMRASGEKDLQK